ncbi:MAG: DUF167 domain-containing protein [Verrucomicrobia bacterium]|nr:DUF167 domain-containing protein [Verrucomicrobiota bacterium]
MKPATASAGCLRAQGDSVLLSVKLQPRAAVTAVGATLGGELRVKVSAPPVDAAANEALVRLLAEVLDCPRRRVELLRGHTSRHKLVKLHGFSVAGVQACLARASSAQTPGRE